MVKKLIFICILFLLSLVVAHKPGLVAVVKKGIVDKVRDKYFTSLFDQLGHQSIPDIKSGDLKLTKITAELSNDSPNNLQASFKEDINAINIDLKNTHIDVKVNWRYHKSILTLKGSARIRGTLSDLGMNIVMQDTKDGDFTIPHINAKDMRVSISKSKIKLDFHCKGCPKPVESLISKALKGKLVDEVQSQIKKQVPKQANSIGNSVIKKTYPKTLNLYDNISLATALTSSIVVKSDHLEVPIDATFFPKSQGYNHSSEPIDIPHYNKDDPGEIMLFFSPYLAQTLAKTIDTEKLVYDFPLFEIQHQLSIDPEAGPTVISFEDGDLIAKGNAKIMAPAYGVGVSIGATLKLDMNILNGEGDNMLSVIPKVKGLQLEKFDFITPKGSPPELFSSFYSPSDSDIPASFIKSLLTSHVGLVGLSNNSNFETPRIDSKELLLTKGIDIAIILVDC